MLFRITSSIYWRIPVAGIGLASIVLGGLSLLSPADAERVAAPLTIEDAIRELEPGWTLRVARRMPEKISAMAIAPEGSALPTGTVFVGTLPTGGVYRFNPIQEDRIFTIGQGLGDQLQHGTCSVSNLGIRDMDHDGTPELLASTSQINPMGRPRLYMWSLNSPGPVLRDVVRPEILSSWSHGLAFVPRVGDGKDSVFITYCGNGEVVEFRPESRPDAAGFRRDSLSWKLVGQVPSSGEAAVSADLDGDGREEICLATGYAPNTAAILAYASDAPGSDVRLVHRIDEGGRFANVQFLVGDLRGDGSRDLFSWWSTDHLYGGQCEIVRYHLGPEGVRLREVIGRGPAKDLWPVSGEMPVQDMDGDGTPEVWFSTKGGDLWRYEAGASPALSRVLRMEGSFGPLVGGAVDNTGVPVLFLAWERSVLQLERAGARSSRDTRSRRAANTEKGTF